MTSLITLSPEDISEAVREWLVRNGWDPMGNVPAFIVKERYTGYGQGETREHVFDHAEIYVNPRPAKESS